MQVIANKISVKELSQIASSMYGHLVKAVVDVSKKVLAIDAEMHADLEQYLIESGSHQSDLWGINLHPRNWGKPEFIEFDSVINLRPSENNSSRSVDDPKVREIIASIVQLKIG